jgi:hypothetical protein
MQLTEHFSLEELIASEVDQIIHEFGRWCHVAFALPSARGRGELLTIATAAQGYQTGLNPVA